MYDALIDLGFALTLSRRDTIAFYDRLAPRYDRIHRRWLRAAGTETMAALHGCLSAELRPGIRVLDAGCGTGRLAHRILDQEPGAQVTQLDAAAGMLDRAGAAAGRVVLGNLLAMPFPDGGFDIVVCAWALETLRDPCAAMRELKRVLAPSGLACCCYCTLPPAWWSRLRSVVLRTTVTRVFRGRFLSPGISRVLGEGRTRWLSCHDGRSLFLCYRKPPAKPVVDLLGARS